MSDVREFWYATTVLTALHSCSHCIIIRAATTESHALYSLHTLYSVATTELCTIAGYDNLMCHAGHYEKGLRKMLKVVRDALQEDCDDEEHVADDDIRDPLLDDARFVKLQELDKLERRIHKAEAVLCTGALMLHCPPQAARTTIS
jgi:hypothetical protein